MQLGHTPLMLASDKGCHKTVEVLLKHGADVTFENKVSQAMSARVRLLLSGFGVRVLL